MERRMGENTNAFCTHFFFSFLFLFLFLGSGWNGGMVEWEGFRILGGIGSVCAVGGFGCW